MFENENFSLSPINFFQISADCHELKKTFPSLAKAKGDFYAVPDTSSLTNEDHFATLFMGWSLEGLEILAVIEKSVDHCEYPDVTKGDSVELFFDTRDVKTSGFNTKFCHHFFFLPEAVEGQNKGEITKFRTEDAHELCDPSDLKLKATSYSKGYSLEIFIPKHCLHGYDPEQFKKLGFTYRINRFDGAPQHFSVVSDEYQIEQQPSLEQFNTCMRTVLFDKHVELHAKIVEFAGFEMPLQYSSIINEHLAVRNHVGIFDVSHMGIIRITGLDAEKFLDYLSTNTVIGSKKHKAIYTVFANETGGSVDDLLIYPEDETHFFIVVNASNKEKCLNHLKKYASNFNVHIQDRFKEDGILSLQGPSSLSLISPLFLEAKNLDKMEFIPVHYHGQKIILSRTGYTGELGFEIYAPNELIVELFDWFLNEGHIFHLLPVGLGARDTLRLEMGYTLYGHEISESISANESVSAWTIRGKNRNFLGKEAMLTLEKSGKARHEYGIIIEAQGIAREGYEVYKDDTLIGKVTSGTFSPSLKKAIAIILVNEKLEKKDSVQVKIRTNLVQANVTTLPFLNRK